MDQIRLEFLATKRKLSKKRQLLPAWPRSEKELPVVELPIDWVRFSTLNHRTSAERRRAAVQAGQPHLFSSDPLGEPAQKAQYEILMAQPGFDELRKDLHERHQQEPAVITADGVLINGNRRAAALKDIHDRDNRSGKYIRCLVLPSDASIQELVALETELQVAQDYKQDYSWVNEGLLIEELYENNNRSFKSVASMMRRKPIEIRKDYEAIQQVNQLVELSNGSRLHVEFEDNQSAFSEMSQHIRNKETAEREGVRAVYLLGTLTDVNYRELRHLRRADAETLVANELSEDQHLAEILETAKQQSQPGTAEQRQRDPLEEALGEAVGDDLVHQLLTYVAVLDRDEPVKLHTGRSVEFTHVKTTIGQAIEKAATEAKERTKDSDTLTAPIMRLEKARKQLLRAKSALPSARAVPGWHEARFEAKLSEVEDCLCALKEED